MGFWSALGSSAMSMASGLSLHDATGGWSDYSSRQSATKYQTKKSKELMALEYAYQQRSLRESPLAYREGLEAAGYNPMLALGDIPSPSVGLGSAGSMPASDGSSKPFEGLAKMTRQTAEKELENLDKTGANIEANSAKAKAEAVKAEAEAAESLNRSEKIKKEADSISPTARKGRDWVGLGKDVATPIASAYGAKKGVEVATKIMKSAGIRNAAFVAREAVPSTVANSAKSAALAVGSASVPAALAVGAGVLGKKAQDSARKNNTSSWRSYRSHTHHMSAGW